MATMELAPSLQHLIDCRLDNIERALMFTNTTRTDRRQIVAAIEDQIFELLSRLEHDEPTRDEVLELLASLDPPETYSEMTDMLSSIQPSRRERPIASNSPPVAFNARVEKHPYNALAIIGLVLASLTGLIAITWWIIAYIGLLLLALVSISGTVCGIVSVCQIVKSKTQKGLWMGIVACSSIVIAGFLGLGTYVVLLGIL